MKFDNVDIDQMKVVKEVRGVCCSCQRLHPVIKNPEVEENDTLDPLDRNPFYDEAENYLMAPHSMFGDIKENPGLPRCNGEGTEPQAIVRD